MPTLTASVEASCLMPVSTLAVSIARRELLYLFWLPKAETWRETTPRDLVAVENAVDFAEGARRDSLERMHGLEDVLGSGIDLAGGRLDGLARRDEGADGLQDLLARLGKLVHGA